MAKKNLNSNLPWDKKNSNFACTGQDCFWYVKIQLGLARGQKQKEWNKMFIHFFCLCALGLTIKLNFNKLKVTYSKFAVLLI